MKKQSLSISIPEPCHENWAEMTPVEKGRHCQSCQKTVIDFTRMPKSKIAEFISQQNGSTCGRFTSDQLNVELLPQKPTSSWLKYAAIIIGLAPALGYSQEAKVLKHQNLEIQQVAANGDIDISTKGEIVQKHVSSSIRSKTKKPSQAKASKILKGQVIDIETGEPILFGTVAIYNNDILITGEETDLEGKFSIEVPSKFDIEASYIGYEPKRIKFKDINFDGEFQIALKEGTLMGTTEVVGMYIPLHHRQKLPPEEQKTIKPINEISTNESKGLKAIQSPIPLGLTAEQKDRLRDSNYPSSDINVICTSYTTTGIMFVSKKETWLKRQWKKFNSMITLSHKEAEKNRKIDKNRTLISSESTASIVEVNCENKPMNDEDQHALIEKSIHVFPNPSSGFFNVEIPLNLSDFYIEVTDMNNQFILRKSKDQFSGTIDLNNYQSGNYVISIFSKRRLLQAIVVQKI